MPPAFNLSQDQTLQFNPSKVSQSTLAPSQSLSFHREIRTRLTSCEHFQFPSPRQDSSRHPTRTPGHPSTHTYRLLLVKDQAGLTIPASSTAGAKRRRGKL